MRKINKKILSLIIIISGAFSLSACQLAKEDSQYKEMENLRGAFITYKLDDKEDDSNGEEYNYDDENKKYYGTFDENIFKKDIRKYNFGDLEGYAIFLHEEGEGDDRVKGGACDSVFQNMNLALNINTEESGKEIISTSEDTVSEPDMNVTSEESKISATIYVTSKFKGIISANPIIKEGKKYYTILDGNNIYADGENEGAYSVSASSDSKTANNSKSKSEKFTYTISIESVDEVKSIRIKEMSSNDTLINTKAIVHKDNDYKFKISKNTAYIIVEETCVDKAGKEIVKRRVYDRDKIDSDTNHLCNYANEDGIVIPKNLYIKK